jgi:hypothetical protein
MTDISSEKIETILMTSAKAALEGTMDDTDRVAMYRLAMTVTSGELYRIEQNAAGTVSPESLMLLQQIALLCDPEVTPEKLFQTTNLLRDVNAAQETPVG